MHDNYKEAADRCDELAKVFKEELFVIIRIYDEDIMRVGELNVN